MRGKEEMEGQEVRLRGTGGCEGKDKGREVVYGGTENMIEGKGITKGRR